MSTHSPTQTHENNPDQAFLEIVYIFVVPVALIYIGIIPYSWRLLVLLGFSLLIMSIIRYQHWNKVQLGLSKLFRPRAIVAYGLFTFVGVLSIIYYAKRFGFDPIDITDWQKSWQLFLFFIPLSVLQEVAYRGFLAQRLREISTNIPHRLLLNALLFTLLHIIYPYAVLTLPIAFVGGFIFAWIYERYPDLILICITHSILNFTAVMFGLFS